MNQFRTGGFEPVERTGPDQKRRIDGTQRERIWFQGRCGNCGAITDQLPCPYCTRAR